MADLEQTVTWLQSNREMWNSLLGTANFFFFFLLFGRGYGYTKCFRNGWNFCPPPPSFPLSFFFFFLFSTCLIRIYRVSENWTRTKKEKKSRTLIVAFIIFFVCVCVCVCAFIYVKLISMRRVSFFGKK